MKKGWIIGICVTVAVLAIAAALVWVFLIPGETWESQDEQSLYPYWYEKTWHEKLFRGITVHIKGSFPEAHSWGATSEDGIVTVKALKTRKPDEVVFWLRPELTGEGTVTCDLCKTEGESSYPVYRITLTVLVNEDNSVSVISNYSGELGNLMEGTGEGFSYQVIPAEDGTVTLIITDPRDSTWGAESDNGAVGIRYLGSDEQAHTQSCQLFYQAVGSGCIYLHNTTAQDETLVLYVSTDLLGKVNVLETSVVPFCYEEVDELERHFQRLAAMSRVPVGALVYEQKQLYLSSTAESEGEEEVEEENGVYPVLCTVFFMDDKRWMLYVLQADTKDLFSKNIESIATETDYLPGEGFSVTLYTHVGGVTATWSDSQGFSYMLRGNPQEMSEFREAAAKVAGIRIGTSS